MTSIKVFCPSYPSFEMLGSAVDQTAFCRYHVRTMEWRRLGLDGRDSQREKAYALMNETMVFEFALLCGAWVKHLELERWV
jgi:hypothetical protein